MQIVVATVDFPPPPHTIATIVVAKPGRGDDGGGKDGLRGKDARDREQRLIKWFQRGINRDQIEEFKQLSVSVAEMFERFLSTYPPRHASGCSMSVASELFGLASPTTAGFFSQFAGAVFGDGLYRLHRAEQVAYWNAIVGDAFPTFRQKFVCFGWDWLGRQFAVDIRRGLSDRGPILMLDPGIGDV